MKIITLILTVMTMLVTTILTSCTSTGTSTGSVLTNPVVQAAITALEQEALQLFENYIKSHLGASKATNQAAFAYVTAQLQQRHPDVSPDIIKAVAASAALK